MNRPAKWTLLPNRAVILVQGQDWRSFLQGLVTQDVETLASGDIRFGALLSPPGRLLFDLFLIGLEGGCMIDCDAEKRAELVQKLQIYRLRAKVEIQAAEVAVAAVWDCPVPEGWLPDPRLPSLGARGYGAPQPPSTIRVDEGAYLDHCRDEGVPNTADWGFETTYPIEANFDLLEGIDFRKGCFVGQETTSRMKRRAGIKNRMAPITFSGPPPTPGAEVLAGDLRAGVVRSSTQGRAMALLRLDRLEGVALTLADGRPCDVAWPDWLKERATA